MSFSQRIMEMNDPRDRLAACETLERMFEHIDGSREVCEFGEQTSGGRFNAAATARVLGWPVCRVERILGQMRKFAAANR